MHAKEVVFLARHVTCRAAACGDVQPGGITRALELVGERWALGAEESAHLVGEPGDRPTTTPVTRNNSRKSHKGETRHPHADDTAHWTPPGWPRQSGHRSRERFHDKAFDAAKRRRGHAQTAPESAVYRAGRSIGPDGADPRDAHPGPRS